MFSCETPMLVTQTLMLMLWDRQVQLMVSGRTDAPLDMQLVYRVCSLYLPGVYCMAAYAWLQR